MEAGRREKARRPGGCHSGPAGDAWAGEEMKWLSGMPFAFRTELAGGH